jgi:hypothetical protein
LHKVVEPRVVVVAVAVAGPHQLQARRQCQALLRFPVVRLRLHLQDKAVEARAVLQQEPAPEAPRPLTLRAIGCHW